MKKYLPLLLFLFCISYAEGQWTQVFDAPGNASNVKVLSSPNDSICWFITNYDSLYKTSDGGTTWTTAGVPAFNPSGLFVVNNDTAFKIGESSIYRTINGGTTWTNVFQSTSSEIPCVWMKNNLEGIFSFGGLLHKTTDGGATWSTATINQPPVNVLNSIGKGTICNFRGDSIWISIVGGGVAFTPDYGATWTVPANAGWLSTSYAHLSFDGPLFGLAVMHNDPFVYVTTDGGNNWSGAINTLGANEDVVVMGSHCWFIPDPADHFFIKYSTDSGATWTQQLSESTGFYTLDKSRTGNTLWAGTGNGKVFVYHDLQTGVNPTEENIQYYKISPTVSNNHFILKSALKNVNAQVIVTDFSGKQISKFFVVDESTQFGNTLSPGNYSLAVYENGKLVFKDSIIKTE